MHFYFRISVKVAYQLENLHSTMPRGRSLVNSQLELGPLKLTSSWARCAVWTVFGAVWESVTHGQSWQGNSPRLGRGDTDNGCCFLSSTRGLGFVRIATAVCRFRTALPVLCDAAMCTMINDAMTVGGGRLAIIPLERQCVAAPYAVRACGPMTLCRAR